MALYEIVVTRCLKPVSTVAVIRSFCPESVAIIQKKINAREVVISVSSDDWPIGSDSTDGPRIQHELFRRCLGAVTNLGDGVEIRYRPSADDSPEVVDPNMLANLMAAELASRAQIHD